MQHYLVAMFNKKNWKFADSTQNVFLLGCRGIIFYHKEFIARHVKQA